MTYTSEEIHHNQAIATGKGGYAIALVEGIKAVTSYYRKELEINQLPVISYQLPKRIRLFTGHWSLFTSHC
ncbi:MAG: hypothetical protein V7L29_01005 [Nostoc sp.]|uniref:hypothetical protein n=1 Tax=Nostoc sp. TaxID=1180 RepID=UPI002FF93D43